MLIQLCFFFFVFILKSHDTIPSLPVAANSDIICGGEDHSAYSPEKLKSSCNTFHPYV